MNSNITTSYPSKNINLALDQLWNRMNSVELNVSDIKKLNNSDNGVSAIMKIINSILKTITSIYDAISGKVDKSSILGTNGVIPKFGSDNSIVNSIMSQIGSNQIDVSGGANSTISDTGSGNPMIVALSTGGNVITKIQSKANDAGYIGTESNHGIHIVVNDVSAISVSNTGSVGVGNAPSTIHRLGVRGGFNAISGYGIMCEIDGELKATQNNDLLASIYVSNTFNHNGKTGVVDYCLYLSGTAANYLGGATEIGSNLKCDAYFLKSIEPSITASATHTQSGGYALTKDINVITICVSDNDTVTLPTGIVGMSITIRNQTAEHFVRVYPSLGGDLGAGTNNCTVTPIQPLKTYMYICYETNTWFETILN
jgi:hypothetical protein